MLRMSLVQYHLHSHDRVKVVYFILGPHAQLNPPKGED